MTVFFDTNILLDVALARAPHFVGSHRVWIAALRKDRCYVSWHTISNFHYLFSKVRGEEVSLEFIRNLLKIVRVSTVAHDDMMAAFGYLGSDLEDAMQIASAQSCGADVIVTRDASGFAKSPIQICHPVDL